MQKKIDINDLDIPKNDIECWNRYPKHKWVYDKSRLFEAQNIEWSPFTRDHLPDHVYTFDIDTETSIPGVYYLGGRICYKKLNERELINQVYILKGEIKLLQHFDARSKLQLDTTIGDVELRINAFVTLYFQKFSGVVTFETDGNQIIRAKLRPEPGIIPNSENVKLYKRIYKKVELDISGHTDRSLHEIIAS